ncbi:MAG: hypothetical protein ABW321_01075, partial [Polyangiales bacterium]
MTNRSVWWFAAAVAGLCACSGDGAKDSGGFEHDEAESGDAPALPGRNAAPAAGSAAPVIGVAQNEVPGA